MAVVCFVNPLASFFWYFYELLVPFGKIKKIHPFTTVLSCSGLGFPPHPTLPAEVKETKTLHGQDGSWVSLGHQQPFSLPDLAPLTP